VKVFQQGLLEKKALKDLTSNNLCETGVSANRSPFRVECQQLTSIQIHLNLQRTGTHKKNVRMLSGFSAPYSQENFPIIIRKIPVHSDTWSWTRNLFKNTIQINSKNVENSRKFTTGLEIRFAFSLLCK
jgi:hypothetical protein